MSNKFRYVYLFFGFTGLLFLIYQLIDTYQDFNPVSILLISIPDMVFFFLAYKTYPVEEPEGSRA